MKVDVGMSGTARRGAMIEPTPMARRVAVVPISSLPMTPLAPALQAASTTVSAAISARSRSWTVSGPSASWNEEKSGLSARKVPWAARCTI